jgi:hypothetical protein
MRHHWTEKSVVVNSADEDAALVGGWAGTPAAFDPCRGPGQARTAQQNAIRWVDDWLVPGVTVSRRPHRADAGTLKTGFTRARGGLPPEGRMPDGSGT